MMSLIKSETTCHSRFNSRTIELDENKVSIPYNYKITITTLEPPAYNHFVIALNEAGDYAINTFFAFIQPIILPN